MNPSVAGNDLWILLLLSLVLVASGCSHPRAPVVDHSPNVGSNRGSGSVVGKPPRAYKVRKGDTLHSIAWRFGLDIHRLAEWNHLAPPYRIYVGQRLQLRPPREGGATVSNAKPPRRSAGGRGQQPVDHDRGNSSIPPSRTQANRKLHWRWPTKGHVIEGFKRNDRRRRGINIGGRWGQPVLAAEAGKVVYVGSDLIGYGKLIIIKHNNDYLSTYGYNRKILVKEGERVARGQRIAEMGEDARGRALLHFEIRYRGSPVDPLAMLRHQR